MEQAVLIACTMNAVRSPMAAAMLRHLAAQKLYVESAGVRAGELDPLAVEAMEEIGLEIGKHRPRCFEDLEDGSFDLVITLSPEAQHKAMELTRTAATRVEYWPTLDPTAVEGSRERRLLAYRAVRDQLMERLKQRFLARAAADT
ncbi:MAG TPA: arsenate reductase ArsC [Rhizomicrobium sp.]|jgi:protein-tyrosine-phosphatase|nr:arsenate reductase ArsC [Rhizomicrobium sp.]